MAKSIITCAYCGKEFERENKQINYNIRKENPNYCGSSCSAKANWENGKLDHLRTGKTPPSEATIANMKVLQKVWYRKNRERLVDKARNVRQLKREFIDSFKIKCCVCGENRKECLVFHHKNPTKKEFNISQAVHRYSTKKIKLEIAKCDVLCSNCHRALHHQKKEKYNGYTKKESSKE